MPDWVITFPSFRKCIHTWRRERINGINEDSTSVIEGVDLRVSGVFSHCSYCFLKWEINCYVYERKNCTFSQPELRSDMEGSRKRDHPACLSTHLTEIQKCSESVSVFHPKQPGFAKSSCLLSSSITSIHISIDAKLVVIATQHV